MALFCNAYGFLAVLAAGIALQRANQHIDVAGSEAPPKITLASQGASEKDGDRCKVCDGLHDAGSPRLQRPAGTHPEVAVVLIVGAMLYYIDIDLTRSCSWR